MLGSSAGRQEAREERDQLVERPEMADAPGHDVLDAADGEVGGLRPSVEVKDEGAVGGKPHRDLASGRLVIRPSALLRALHGWTI